MKKNILIIFTTITLFLGIQLKTNAEEKKVKPEFEKRKIEYLRVLLKDAMETRKRMREIEKEAIQNDPELKALADEIMKLRKEMREKLNEKLKNDGEYQNLKKRMKEIWDEWNEKRKEVK